MSDCTMGEYRRPRAVTRYIVRLISGLERFRVMIPGNIGMDSAMTVHPMLARIMARIQSSRSLRYRIFTWQRSGTPNASKWSGYSQLTRER